MTQRLRFTSGAIWNHALKQIKEGRDEYETFWDIIDALNDLLDERTDECEEQEKTINILNHKLRELKHKLKKSNSWGYVYLMEGGGYYKIGLSTRPPQRSFNITPKMPFEVKLVHVIESDNARKLETELHQQFGDRHLRGEWFNLAQDDIERFRNL